MVARVTVAVAAIVAMPFDQVPHMPPVQVLLKRLLSKVDPCCAPKFSPAGVSARRAKPSR